MWVQVLSFSYNLFLSAYYKKNCNYKYINKFVYSKINELPRIKKIILSFKLNNFNLKLIAVHFLILQQLSNKNNGLFTKAKKSNMLLKIKKGNVVGCEFLIKTTKLIITFLKKLILELLLKKQPRKKAYKSKSVYYKINNIILLTSFDKLFNLYKAVNKTNLNITIVMNLKKHELLYTLNKFKI
jgi:ribosomal protein L5